MCMHPDLLKQLANDHQRQMLREAEGERQLMRARPEPPHLAIRMRLHLSALYARFSLRSRVRPDSHEVRLRGLETEGGHDLTPAQAGLVAVAAAFRRGFNRQPPPLHRL